jgi:hypothetical protein
MTAPFREGATAVRASACHRNRIDRATYATSRLFRVLRRRVGRNDGLSNHERAPLHSNINYHEH